MHASTINCKDVWILLYEDFFFQYAPYMLLLLHLLLLIRFLCYSCLFIQYRSFLHYFPFATSSFSMSRIFFTPSFHIPFIFPIAKFLVYYFFTKSFCKNRLFHILLLNPRFRRIIDRKHWKKRKSKIYARNIGGGSILSNNRFPRQLSRFVHRDVEQWREREKEREVGSSKWRKPSVVCSGVGRGFNGKCGGKLSSSFKEWTNRMAISFGMTWI